MYRILMNERRDFKLPIVTKFSLALIEGDQKACLAEAEQMNALLLSTAAQSPTHSEALFLDTAQSTIHLYAKNHGALDADFSAIYSRLFHAFSLPYSAELLLEICNYFYAYWKNTDTLDALDAVCALSDRMQEDTVLCYLVRRDSLNLLLLSAQFLKRLELTRTLTAALERCPETVRNEALAFGGDLFVYNAKETTE